MANKICYKRKFRVINRVQKSRFGRFLFKKMEISGKKMRWLESYPKSEFIPIVFERNSVDVVTKKRNLEVRDVAFERFTLYLIPVYSRPT